MLRDRSLTQDSRRLHRSWVNEIGGHSYDSRHGSWSDFEENRSDGYDVGFESDVLAISTSLAADIWSEWGPLFNLQSSE